MDRTNWLEIMSVITDTERNEIWDLIHEQGKMISSQNQNGYQYLTGRDRKFPLIYQKATKEQLKKRREERHGPHSSNKSKNPMETALYKQMANMVKSPMSQHNKTGNIYAFNPLPSGKNTHIMPLSLSKGSFEDIKKSLTMSKDITQLLGMV